MSNLNKINDLDNHEKDQSVSNAEGNFQYTKNSLKESKEYWVDVFTKNMHSLEEGEKIDIAKFRDIEPNIDLFLDDIIDNICSFTGYDEIYFISSYLTIDEISKKHIKTSKIEGIDINNEELAEKVGDLFYDSLAGFLSLMSDKIKSNSEKENILGNENTSNIYKKLSELLEQSSKHILTAWEICLPYVSHDFPEMKHTTELKGIKIDKTELSKRIGNLTELSLKDFLDHLSNKIKKDGEADKGRGRIKLATELFESSNRLKEASDLI